MKVTVTFAIALLLPCLSQQQSGPPRAPGFGQPASRQAPGPPEAKQSRGRDSGRPTGPAPPSFTGSSSKSREKTSPEGPPAAPGFKTGSIPNQLTPFQAQIESLKRELKDLSATVLEVKQDMDSYISIQNERAMDLKAKILDSQLSGNSLKEEVEMLNATLIENQARFQRMPDDLNTMLNQLSDQRNITNTIAEQTESVQELVEEYSSKLETLKEDSERQMQEQHSMNENFMVSITRQGNSISEIFLDNVYRQFLPHDCSDLFDRGVLISGVYTVYLNRERELEMQVYCDMQTAGGGWTVFQKRQDGSEDFYRSWSEYANGFGKKEGEFWLGNYALSNLTYDAVYRLRVDLTDWDGNTAFFECDTFILLPESRKFTAVIDGCVGTAEDSLIPWHRNTPFSTKDRDNDFSADIDCAKRFKGGWWYNMCHAANLNGQYSQNPHVGYGQGLTWYSWKGYHYSLKKTEMKIKPHSHHSHRP